MSITSVILRKTFQWEGGGGMISRREIPSPSTFDKEENRKERPLLTPGKKR